MTKPVFLILILFSTLQIFAQDGFTPVGYQVLQEKNGDLDKDGIDEKVVVYNTNDSTEDGFVREIRIYKYKNEKWVTWISSKNAMLKSQEGGMMGDPFENFSIDKGILTINYSGGSSWKWFYSDKYRFQNNKLQLIGYIGSFGKACEYWEYIDFNLSTGRLEYKKEFEDCEKGQEIYKKENETFFKKGILLDINNRITKKIKIVTPKYKHEIEL